MASELSRDLLVLSKKPELLTIWQDREKQENKRLYQEQFKFDHGHAANKYAFTIYKFTCAYGVHGHNTSLMHSSASGEFSTVGANFAELSVTNKGIANCLTVWLSAFFAIYANIADCLKLRNLSTDATKKFQSMVISLSNDNKLFLKYLDTELGIKFT